LYVRPVRTIAAGASINTMAYTSDGEIVSNSAKTFVIPHPLESERYLVHGCLEGPEAGVYYRGQAQLPWKKENMRSNHTTMRVDLPDYTVAFSNFTVHLTPVFAAEPNILSNYKDEDDAPPALWASDVSKDINDYTELLLGSTVTINKRSRYFVVKGTAGTRFNWLVHATRTALDAEPFVELTNVKGTGPYKWI
jgi:hypothetical protein